MHARTLLQHLVQRDAVLDRFVAATRPGGGIVVEDTYWQAAAWCRSTVAPDEVPTRRHLVADPPPRTASGKLVKDDRRRLVETHETPT